MNFLIELRYRRPAEVVSFAWPEAKQDIERVHGEWGDAPLPMASRALVRAPLLTFPAF